jgi:hypothetical protein
MTAVPCALNSIEGETEYAWEAGPGAESGAGADW